MADLEIINEGTVVLVRPVTDRGSDWLADHVITNETMMWGPCVVAEPRFVWAIVEGAREADLVVASA